MRLTERQKQIVHALYAQHTDLAKGDDDQRRALTLLIAQQMCFEFGDRWGTKRADPGRPPSKDSITFKSVTGQLLAWDWQDGTTRAPGAGLDGEGKDISEQVFIQVEPINHLGVTPIPDPGTTLPAPPVDDRLDRALNYLDAQALMLAVLSERLTALTAKVDALLAQPPQSVVFPNYVGAMGWRLRLTPEKKDEQVKG